MIKLNVNDRHYEVDVEADTPLLWVLRDEIGLTGTKFGCGIAQCGACTVHVDGKPMRSCVLPASSIGNKKITTIEHLARDGYHPVQQGLGRVAGAPVRLLPVGANHVGRRPARR